MTEDEAKTKWCPMVRATMGSTLFCTNRDGNLISGVIADFNVNCIGSACMMWRWHGAVVAEGMPVVPNVPTLHGYCGLAGK